MTLQLVYCVFFFGWGELHTMMMFNVKTNFEDQSNMQCNCASEQYWWHITCWSPYFPCFRLQYAGVTLCQYHQQLVFFQCFPSGNQSLTIIYSIDIFWGWWNLFFSFLILAVGSVLVQQCILDATNHHSWIWEHRTIWTVQVRWDVCPDTCTHFL